MTDKAKDGTGYDQRWNSHSARHEIRFHSKPSAEIRQNLKDHGARRHRAGGFWYIEGFTYAGDDIPLIINGDPQAGCHGAAAEHDERVYSGGGY